MNMSSELAAVIVGGIIGMVGSLTTTLVLQVRGDKKRKQSILAVTKAEITAIKEKAQRFVDSQSSAEELGASTPMLTSIASQLGYLSPEQAIAFRRTVTLDMEMRKGKTIEKATTTIKACDEALNLF